MKRALGLVLLLLAVKPGYGSGELSVQLELEYRTFYEQDLDPEKFDSSYSGSLQPELVAAARQRGLVVYPIRPSFDDLLAQLAPQRRSRRLHLHGHRTLTRRRHRRGANDETRVGHAEHRLTAPGAIHHEEADEPAKPSGILVARPLPVKPRRRGFFRRS